MFIQNEIVVEEKALGGEVYWSINRHLYQKDNRGIAVRYGRNSDIHSPGASRQI